MRLYAFVSPALLSLRSFAISLYDGYKEEALEIRSFLDGILPSTVQEISVVSHHCKSLVCRSSSGLENFIKTQHRLRSFNWATIQLPTELLHALGPQLTQLSCAVSHGTQLSHSAVLYVQSLARHCATLRVLCLTMVVGGNNPYGSIPFDYYVPLLDIGTLEELRITQYSPLVLNKQYLLDMGRSWPFMKRLALCTRTGPGQELRAAPIGLLADFAVAFSGSLTSLKYAFDIDGNVPDAIHIERSFPNLEELSFPKSEISNADVIPLAAFVGTLCVKPVKLFAHPEKVDPHNPGWAPEDVISPERNDQWGEFRKAVSAVQSAISARARIAQVS